MEYNGMLYANEAAVDKAQTLQEESDALLKTFHNLCGMDCVSITSGDDLSAVLYGGVVEEVFRVPIGYYKSGLKKGEVKYGKEVLEHTFPRLVEPLKKTETAKNITGQKETWEVNVDVLQALKVKGKGKEIIECVLAYRGLEKLRSTYLQGWSDMIEKKHWADDMIHGSLNQCVTITGRLSSDSPNMQNAPKAVKQFLVSRYK
jgi:DNA polymerase I-like protein with 3'-5' exonuclease and polymerase domains